MESKFHHLKVSFKSYISMYHLNPSQRIKNHFQLTNWLLVLNLNVMEPFCALVHYGWKSLLLPCWCFSQSVFCDVSRWFSSQTFTLAPALVNLRHLTIQTKTSKFKGKTSTQVTQWLNYFSNSSLFLYWSICPSSVYTLCIPSLKYNYLFYFQSCVLIDKGSLDDVRDVLVIDNRLNFQFILWKSPVSTACWDWGFYGL